MGLLDTIGFASGMVAQGNRNQQFLNNRGIQTASQLAADRASIDAGNARARALWASNRTGETTGIQNTVIHEGPTSMYSSMKARQSQNPRTMSNNYNGEVNANVFFPGNKRNMTLEQYPSQSTPRTNTQQFQLGGTPRPADPRMGVKDSGAPVSFSPSSVQTMNGMFGSPMQNSYDRSMSPMKQDMMMNDVSANVDPITGMPVNDVMY